MLENIPELGYLRGATMNNLMNAELRGTVDALKVSKRPVIRVTLPRLNAHTVAQLLYMLEVETAMAGRLYNINAFNQPGVEEEQENRAAADGRRGVSEGTPPGMNDLTPPPPPPPLSFPEYGQGGDYAGQRRARRQSFAMPCWRWWGLWWRCASMRAMRSWTCASRSTPCR